eukprot:3373024-Ditylum_brightwellii.AAC.1
MNNSSHDMPIIHPLDRINSRIRKFRREAIRSEISAKWQKPTGVNMGDNRSSIFKEWFVPPQLVLHPCKRDLKQVLGV